MTDGFVSLEDKLVSREQFQNWFGSDHYENPKELTDLILQLINSQYMVDKLREDIKSYG
jgi:hypothetical protein